MKNSKPVSTALATHFILLVVLLLQSEEVEQFMSHVSFSSTIGCIMYAMVCTCPYISHKTETNLNVEIKVLSFISYLLLTKSLPY